MSKTLGIIAAVTIAVTALLALRNKGAYERAIADIELAKQLEKTLTADIASEQKRVRDAKLAFEDFSSQDEEVKADLEKSAEELDEAKQEVIVLEQSFEGNKSKITESKEILEGLPNPRDLVPKVKRMRTELATLNDDVATKESKLANLTSEETGLKANVSKVRELIGLQSSGESFPSMHAHISSIYPGLGFVILNAGDKQGVVSGSILDVNRGGEVIGKLKVTAVEAGRSTADIILNSVPVGTTLQSGDSVSAANKNAVAAAQ